MVKLSRTSFYTIGQNYYIEQKYYAKLCIQLFRTNQKSLLDQCEMNFLLKHPKVAQLISLKKWATRLRNKRINTQSLKSAQLKVKTAIDIGLLFFTNVIELDPDYDFYQQTDVVKTFFWKCKSPKTVRKIQTKIRTDKPMNSLRDVANIFGYTLEETRKVRVNGKPERFYKMSESLMESEYAQAILECIHRKYERILLEIEQEETDEQKPDPFDFGLQGEEAEVVRSWINSVKDTAKNDVKKLVENHPQKQLQTFDMPRSKGVALPGVSLYINNGTSATLSDQIEALYQACWNLTSWRQFEELGKRYPHEVKQLAWDLLRSTPNGKKRAKEILAYRNRVEEPLVTVDSSNVVDTQVVEDAVIETAPERVDTSGINLDELEIVWMDEPPTTQAAAEPEPIALDESRESFEPLFEFSGRCGTWKIVEQVDSERVKVINLAGWATGHCLTIETEISKLRRIA